MNVNPETENAAPCGHLFFGFRAQLGHAVAKRPTLRSKVPLSGRQTIAYGFTLLRQRLS